MKSEVDWDEVLKEIAEKASKERENASGGRIILTEQEAKDQGLFD
ncbi:MAG: hypothetical protein PHF45_01895 [Candidatus Pacebacteria bacterium]|nr:hypothetical protein [Candidatus Paceibacterota bacterium]